MVAPMGNVAAKRIVADVRIGVAMRIAADARIVRPIACDRRFHREGIGERKRVRMNRRRIMESFPQEATLLSSPLTKGGLRRVLRAGKNLPQPLLVKEGSRRRCMGGEQEAAPSFLGTAVESVGITSQ